MDRLNPLTTLVFVLSIVLMVFIVPLPWFSAGIFLFVLVPVSVFTNSFKTMAGVVFKFLLPFSVFLFSVHCFLIPSDNNITLYGIAISYNGFLKAFLISSRVAVMVGSITILFKTTDPVRITRELALRGVPPGPLYVINTTLQILPRMKKRTETIREAQRARGLDTKGSFIKRTKALIPMIGPLFFGLFREVEQRALILETKGFSGSNRENFSFNSKDGRLQKILRLICLLSVLTALLVRIWIQFT